MLDLRIISLGSGSYVLLNMGVLPHVLVVFIDEIRSINSHRTLDSHVFVSPSKIAGTPDLVHENRLYLDGYLKFFQSK